MENELNILSSRAGFNTALRHFKVVSGYISEIEKGKNLADLINASLDDGEIKRYQVKSILNALLIERLGYSFKSHNIINNVEKTDHVAETVSEWGNIQIVMAYFHPQTGLSVINPKNNAQWESLLPLIRDELLVLYAGPVQEQVEKETLESALNDFITLLYGGKVKTRDKYRGKERAPAPTPSAEGVVAPSRRVTPRYSVQVTNELFHNGNVEAWKKIIESYKTKYPDLDVMIWYENERINDINALFKWGKVKHGGLIFFSVAGENIKDVSKLQRYLFEGASPRFEAFLRGGIGQVLDLF